MWTANEFNKKWEIETKKTLEERARKAAEEERQKALNGGKKKEKKEKKKKGKPEPEKEETYSIGPPCANHYREYRILWDRQCQEAWYRGAVTGTKPEVKSAQNTVRLNFAVPPKPDKYADRRREEEERKKSQRERDKRLSEPAQRVVGESSKLKKRAAIPTRLLFGK